MTSTGSFLRLIPFTPAAQSKSARFAATIGFFDGVHRGHAFLIEKLRHEARKRKLLSLVVTFEQSPRHVIAPPFEPQLLTSAPERIAMLKRQGIDAIALLHFDAAMSRLSAARFMKDALQPCGVEFLLMGHNHVFGSDRLRDLDAVRAAARPAGIEVERADSLLIGGHEVSSTRIRQLLLADGDAAQAMRLLGHPYALTGTVVKGFQVGRTLGFPTINVQPEDGSMIIPLSGVYAATTTLHENNDRQRTFATVVNIGTRPTFSATDTQTIEAFLLDFAGNLYDTQVTLRFYKRLRSERRFANARALQQQIEHDAEICRALNLTHAATNQY